MKSKIWMLSTAAILCGTMVSAQHAVTAVESSTTERSEAERNAHQRAEAYVSALGVDKAVAERMTSVFLEAEKEVAPLREECATIQAKVAGAMEPYDAKVESMLTREQQEKLARMKKEGTWTPGVAGCSPADAMKPGCAGHEKAAGGCCAGKADAHGKAAKTTEPARH